MGLAIVKMLGFLCLMAMRAGGRAGYFVTGKAGGVHFTNWNFPSEVNPGMFSWTVALEVIWYTPLYPC